MLGLESYPPKKGFYHNVNDKAYPQKRVVSTKNLGLYHYVNDRDIKKGSYHNVRSRPISTKTKDCILM